MLVSLILHQAVDYFMLNLMYRLDVCDSDVVTFIRQKLLQFGRVKLLFHVALDRIIDTELFWLV